MIYIERVADAVFALPATCTQHALHEVKKPRLRDFTRDRLHLGYGPPYAVSNSTQEGRDLPKQTTAAVLAYSNQTQRSANVYL